MILGATVQLDGSTSCDGDGDSLTFNWTFLVKPAGSNASIVGASTSNPSFFPDRVGTYTLELIVDDGSETVSDTVVITVTAQGAIEELIEEVLDLVSSGSLNPGQGSSLIVKLESALKSLNSGKVKTAQNQLQTFINEVEDLIANGVLSEAEGRPLIDAAQIILNGI